MLIWLKNALSYFKRSINLIALSPGFPLYFIEKKNRKLSESKYGLHFTKIKQGFQNMMYFKIDHIL